MEKKIAPSEQKAQALRTMLQGQSEGQSGEELLSLLVRLSAERILQEALEEEQAEALGRGRYEARGEKLGYRNGYENGTLKTGEGVLHVKVPQIWGQAAPYRSPLWRNVANTSEVLKKLIVEMYVGGMSQRDIEYGLESALGQFVLSKSTVSDIAESLTEEYEVFRTRDLSQEPVAYLRGGRDVAEVVADSLLVSQNAKSAAKSPGAGLAGVQSLGRRHAGCAEP